MMLLIAIFGLLPTYLLRFAIGPLPSTILEVLVAASFVQWVLQGQWRNASRLRPFAAPAGLLLLASVVAVAIAPDTLAALGLWRAYILAPLLVFVMTVTSLSKNDWYRAGLALSVSGMVVAVLGLLQWATGMGIPAPWDVERRITSIFDYPNALGLFLAPILAALAVTRAHAHHSRADRWKIDTALVAMTTAVVLAKTEAALIAIPTALLLTLWFSLAHVRTKIIATAVAIVLFFTAFAAVPPVREKVLLNDVSGQARTTMWQETLAMLADRPFTGAGLSGYPTAIAPYHDATYFEIFQYPHNVILNIWTELGLLGLLAALTVAFIAIRITWQYRRDPMVLAAFAALATMCIHGLVDVPFFKNDLALMTAGFLAFLAWRSTQKTA